MNIYKVLPDLANRKQMSLWHKALRAQWSAEDVDWSAPRGIRSDGLRDRFARILTPVLMGEQSALYSVSSLIPILGHRSEVEGQMYLTTWAVDEARHTELFARFYGRLEREPMSIRRFPAGYLFQSKIASKEPAEWLSGVLVSEVLAKLVMEEFCRLDLDPVLSEISQGVLEDEARHLGFNHLYLRQRFSRLYNTDERAAEDLASHLHQHRTGILDFVPPVFAALKEELAEVGIDTEALFSKLCSETEERLEHSIRRGRSTAGVGEDASVAPVAG